MKKWISVLMVLSLLAPTANVEAKGIFKKKKPKTEKKKGKNDIPAPAPPAKKPGELPPYGSVITDKAKTMNGFFRVHSLEGKYYFEIADSLLNRDILVVSRIVKAPVSREKQKAGYPGDYTGENVLRFEKAPGNKLFLREISYIEHSSDTLGMYKSVQNSNEQPIIAAFDLKSVRKESGTKNFVIDMTDYIKSDNPTFSFSGRAKNSIGLMNMANDASYIDTLKAFPINIEVQTVRTYQRKPSSPNDAGGRMTYKLNTSLLLLPEKPMKPRRFDPRVAYFAVGYTDFDSNPHGVDYKASITRWRLEPKEEDVQKYLNGELVEPKKPIVIYIDPATPKKWVPYLIAGVNDWQKAFEKAGFKNAIIAKEAPTDDPTWSLEDARHSAIIYKPSDIPNASGPHVHDPRSGEILETHINWYHNVMSLLHYWYVVQAGAIDPATHKPVLDDELMGQLIRFVSSHEVGHTLGLRHNFGSSSTVPVEKLRDKAWVEANGHTPSIMDYARFNYIAQPEDNISREGIFPRIGMYDLWSVEWGYRWMPQYATADDETPYLNKWVIDTLKKDIRYTFGTETDRDDPRNQSEDLGDDAMLASSYGIKNMKRILPEVLNWTSQPDKGYGKAASLYQNIIDQYGRYMGHVTTNIAGIYNTPVTVEQTDTKATEYVSKDKQKRAVEFLNKELFNTPAWLMDKDLIEKTQVNVNFAISAIQANTLGQLLRAHTFNKMSANEQINGTKAYTATDLFRDLKRGIWSDLNGGKRPDFNQRNLQKLYVKALINLLGIKKADNFQERPDINPSDAPAIARGQLIELKRALNGAAGSSTGVLKGHYLNLAAMIEAAFNAK